MDDFRREYTTVLITCGKSVGAGLATIGLTSAAGIRIGLVFSALVFGLSRNPSELKNMFKYAMLGVAVGLLALLLAFLKMFTLKAVKLIISILNDAFLRKKTKFRPGYLRYQMMLFYEKRQSFDPAIFGIAFVKVILKPFKVNMIKMPSITLIILFSSSFFYYTYRAFTYTSPDLLKKARLFLQLST